jgi:hypothetical protein
LSAIVVTAGHCEFQCHANPQTAMCNPPLTSLAEGSRLCKWLEKADSSPAAQNDIRLICALRHGLVAGERKKASFLPNLIRHRLSYLSFTHQINQP